MALVLFAFNGNAQSACSSDCMFGECRIKCDKSSTATCNCVIGLFSSCKCSEKVMTATLSEEQATKTESLSRFVSEKYHNELSELIIETISALKKEDVETYYSNLEKLLVLEKEYPNEIKEIKEYAYSLK